MAPTQAQGSLKGVDYSDEQELVEEEPATVPYSIPV